MKKAPEGNILMDSKISMDSIMATLKQIEAGSPEETAEVCKAAANILSAISMQGAKTAEDAMDIIRDYRILVKPDVTLDIVRDYRALVRQGYSLQQKHAVADKPFSKDGVWHCPDCNGRCKLNHSFCHRCGKKLDWR